MDQESNLVGEEAGSVKDVLESATESPEFNRDENVSGNAGEIQTGTQESVKMTEEEAEIVKENELLDEAIEKISELQVEHEPEVGDIQFGEETEDAGEEYGKSDEENVEGEVDEENEEVEEQDEIEVEEPSTEPITKNRAKAPPAKLGLCTRYETPYQNPELDVFLMIRRKKTTIFLDAKEDTSVIELKRMICGITKVLPENQRLFYERKELDEKKKISDYDLDASTARPQRPATIELIFKDENGEWETIDIAPLSQPPELPEVMRQQETTNPDSTS